MSNPPCPPPTIWYVHHYAGGPDVGRFYRPFELARYWQSNGAKVVVITAAFHHILNAPNERQGYHLIEGVPYEFLPTPSYQGNGIKRILNMAAFTVQILRHAKNLVHRHGVPDMIIGSSPHPFTFLATHHLAQRFNAMSVFEVRDLWPLSLTELLNVSTKHPLVLLLGAIERYAYKHADKVVSLLPKTLSYMTAHGLTHPDSWHYIPNGVDMQRPIPVNADSDALSQARQWRAAGKFILAYPGALGKPNNMSPLIEAMNILRQRGRNDIALLIVGQGEQMQQLKTEVDHKKLQDRIAIHPQINKNAVIYLLQNVDAGYLSVHKKPALYRFGISLNKLFDYMYAKLPIIYAIEAGNNPVAECQCGYSVAPDKPEDIATALETMAALPAMARRAMGERGYQYGLQHHHYPTLANQYLTLLPGYTAAQPEGV